MHIKTNFPWIVTLPSQCLWNQFIRSLTCNNIITKDSRTRTCNIRVGRIAGTSCILASQNTPWTFQLQIIDYILFLHECFFTHNPTGTEWIKIIPCISCSLKYGRTVTAIRSIQQITIFIVIQCTEQIGHCKTFVLGSTISSWCSIINHSNPPLIYIFANGNTITRQLTAATR